MPGGATTGSEQLTRQSGQVRSDAIHSIAPIGRFTLQIWKPAAACAAACCARVVSTYLLHPSVSKPRPPLACSPIPSAEAFSAVITCVISTDTSCTCRKDDTSANQRRSYCRTGSRCSPLLPTWAGLEQASVLYRGFPSHYALIAEHAAAR